MEEGTGKLASHQVLHDAVRDVELEGAGAAHIRRVAQVVDGEVQCEWLLADLPSCDRCRESQGLWVVGAPNVHPQWGFQGPLVLLPINPSVACEWRQLQQQERTAFLIWGPEMLVPPRYRSGGLCEHTRGFVLSGKERLQLTTLMRNWEKPQTLSSIVSLLPHL